MCFRGTVILLFTISLTWFVSGVSTTVRRYDEYADSQRRKMKSDFKVINSNRQEPAWGCSDFGHIFSAMRDADPLGDKVFIDIGFNKGYQFAYWAALWTPEVGMNSTHWHELIIGSASEFQHLSRLHAKTCGVCRDCKGGVFDFPFTAPPANAPKLKIIGVDLNKENIYIQEKIQRALESESSPWSTRIDLKLIHAGASNFTGQMMVPICAKGDEDCSLKKSKYTRRPVEAVNIVTVDAIISDLKASRNVKKNGIDMLLIDTEGNDPLVIEGGVDALRNGLVRCLIFEYHYRGFWAATSLRYVTQRVEEFGFMCYLSALGALWPLNKGHWRRMYEVRRWSNVFCLKEEDVWFQSIQPFVYHPDKFHCVRTGCTIEPSMVANK